MHDLIHDTAQHVSMHECLLMTDLSYFGRHEFRHMSVEVDAESLNTMKNIQHLNRLRSLRFGKFFSAEITWFSQLSNILFLSLKGCRLVKLPESICELSSLRYLDISNSKVKELPEKFWCLYSLQVVDASHSCMETIHKDVTKLIKLRKLALPNKASIALSKLPGLGNLSCLRHLRYFTVGNQEGSIAELKAMNQLRGMLSIKSIHNVNSQEEASAARLVDKKCLKELNLIWRLNPRTSHLSPHENEVADGLRPIERIEGLKIHGFWRNRLPSWLNPENLQNLRRLELSHCFCFETLSISHSGGGTQGDSTGKRASSSANCSNASAFLAFTHLTRISIMHCNGLKNLDQFLSPKNLPSVEVIHLLDCSNLESDFVGFVHLRDLLLAGCISLVCPQ
jgi:Leucine-rich repeat (LRR) protein